MRCYVIMGVAGCGKTSVGEALAQRGLVTFVDGDALHTPENIEKMSSGIPLNDDDREPWLQDVGRNLKATDGPVAIGCSALKRSYRDIIRDSAGEPVFFLHLNATQSVVAGRMAARAGHFMPPALLDSQYATLEALRTDEDGQGIDISQEFDAVVEDTAQIVRLMRA